MRNILQKKKNNSSPPGGTCAFQLPTLKVLVRISNKSHQSLFALSTMARDASGITGGSVSKVKEEAESNRTDKTLAVDARSLFDAKCTCYARAALPALFRPNFQLPKSQISEPLIRSTVNVVQLFAPLECRANSSENKKRTSIPQFRRCSRLKVRPCQPIDTTASASGRSRHLHFHVLCRPQISAHEI